MRTTFSSLAASLAAFVVLNATPAVAQSSSDLDTFEAPFLSESLASFELMPVSLTQSVADLSEVVNSHIAMLETELERLDDEARFQRVLERRGRKLEPRWTAPAPELAEEAIESAYQPTFPEAEMSWESSQVSEDQVSYGNYSGPANPLIVGTIMEFNLEISPERAEQLARLIEASADRYGVDPLLITALVSQESAFYQTAVSHVGATGLGQLMPETAADLGVNPYDAEENLDGCVRYLADQLYYWSGSEDPTALALASYNAGAGNVEHYGGIPPFEETQNYVVVIKDRYATLSSGTTVFGG